MKKDLGIHPYLFPISVLMITTYGEENVVDVMNVGWGGTCAVDKVLLHLAKGHKTSANIRNKKAFTVSIANAEHAKEADDFGIVSGNKVTDKFERSNLQAIKSTKVDAPILLRNFQSH